MLVCGDSLPSYKYSRHVAMMLLGHKECEECQSHHVPNIDFEAWACAVTNGIRTFLSKMWFGDKPRQKLMGM